MNVGFVGLGNMGGSMAHRLIEVGHDVTVFDVDPAAVAALEEAGATGAKRKRDIVASTEIVVLCLPSPQEVEAVVLGDDGLASSLEPPQILVDTTTSTPKTSETVARRLSKRGVEFVGAPVSGGRAGAEAGTLTAMVGGDEGTVQNCVPVLRAFAERIIHVGDRPEYGHAMKLLNNYLSYVNLVATTEATLAGRAVGMELETMLEVFNASSGRNSWTEDKFPEEVLTGEFAVGATLQIGRKDVELSQAFIKDTGADTGIGDAVLAAIEESIEDLGTDADLMRFYEYHRATVDGPD